MSLVDRLKLFGEASETLAPEAAWGFRRQHGTWPLWDEAVQYLSESSEVGGDQEEAERRLLAAISDGEVRGVLHRRVWFIELSQDVSDVIARRYMDRTMPRRHQEDQC